jgi:hypothetical protein
MKLNLAQLDGVLPATPLPWIAVGVNLSGIKGKHYPLAIYGEQSQHMVASIRGDRDNASAGDIQDADYISVAANNFPALLALAREQEAQIQKLRAVLAQAQSLRPALLRQYHVVPEYVLDFCNTARAALAE